MQLFYISVHLYSNNILYITIFGSRGNFHHEQLVTIYGIGCWVQCWHCWCWDSDSEYDVQKHQSEMDGIQLQFSS